MNTEKRNEVMENLLTIANTPEQFALHPRDRIQLTCKDARELIEKLESDNDRLREAIENARPPECQCYNIGSNVHGNHVSGCLVIQFEKWKRDALKEKP